MSGKFERCRHTAVFWRMIRSSGGGIWQNNADGGGEGGGALGQCSGNIIAEFGVVSRNGTPTFITIDTIMTCVK